MALPQKKAQLKRAGLFIKSGADQGAWILDACSPFGPCVTSKVTF